MAAQIMRVNPLVARPAVDPVPFRRYPVERRTFQNVQAVAASSTAFIDLPIGVTYRRFHLLMGGTTFTAANVTSLRVIANSQVIHNLSGTNRDILNQFDKLPASATYKALTIPFDRIDLKEGADEWTCLATGIPCQQAPRGIRTLRIEVDINSGAVAPTLELHCEVRANDKDLARALLRTESYVEVVPAVGAATDYLFAHKYNGDRQRPLLQRLAMNQGDTEINRVKMDFDTREVFNRTAKGNEHGQSVNFIRSPYSGWTIMDSGEDGYSRPWRVGDVADHRIYANVNTGGYNMTVIAETLGTLPS